MKGPGKGFNISLLILLISFFIAFYYNQQFPEKIPIHWNAQGEVDGYGSKFEGLFLTPLITLGILALMAVVPMIDPLKKNIDKFMVYYDGMIVVFTVFMVYIHILIVMATLGYSFNMVQALSPAFAMLFYYVGILLEKAKRNWFIGIRTPWTLSSDRVWDKTHKKGAGLFKAAGLISLLGTFLGSYSIYVIIGPVMAFSIYLVIYSYMEFNRENRKRRK